MKIVIFTLEEDFSDEFIQTTLVKTGEILGCGKLNCTILNEKDLAEIAVKHILDTQTVNTTSAAKLLDDITNDFNEIAAIAFEKDDHDNDPSSAQANLWKSLTSRRAGALNISKIKRLVYNIEKLKMDKKSSYRQTLNHYLTSNSSFYLIYDICKKIIS